VAAGLRQVCHFNLQQPHEIPRRCMLLNGEHGNLHPIGACHADCA
jgi:hypothetical protein